MLIFFPLSYPYTIAKEETFLKDEVSTINKTFLNFILIPSIINEDKYKLDDSISINLNLAKYLNKKSSLLLLLFNIHFFWLFIIEILSNKNSLKNIKKLILYIWNTVKIYNWIKKNLDPIIQSNKDSQKILYTFWFTHLTTALCYYYKNSKNIKIVTRTHGIDLYEYRNNNYIPLREFSIKHLSKIYFVSETGKNYMIQKYPKYINKYFTYPLGVKSHGSINILEKNNEFHFISCSNVDHNKNVKLILYALKEVALKHKDKIIHWTHFGSGELLDDLLNTIKNLFCPNLKVDLMGYQPNGVIFEFYKNKSINAFITTSHSEGGRPLSVQEALSFGIPVIASSVGGITEIINESNGYLLSSKPSIYELIDAITTVIHNPELWEQKRSQAIKTFTEKCNSEVLTYKFIEELKTL